MEIFLVIDGAKNGPMTIYEVRELLRKDKINSKTLQTCQFRIWRVEARAVDKTHDHPFA